MLPDKIKVLDLSIGSTSTHQGQLIHQSRFEFRYLGEDPDQRAVGLLMPPVKLTYGDTALFSVMDQNLPEGDLFMRLRQMFPKQPLTAMHLLALSGANGIGRLGFSIPGLVNPKRPVFMSKANLLATTFTPEIFDDLVHAYLQTEQAHLLRAYNADFLVNAIEAVKACRPLRGALRLKVASFDRLGHPNHTPNQAEAVAEASVGVIEKELRETAVVTIVKRQNLTR